MQAAAPGCSGPGPHQTPPHLGAERGLFVEIAVHELTVFPSGDLTAAGQGGKANIWGLSPARPPPPRLVPSARPQQASLAGRGAPLQEPAHTTDGPRVGREDASWVVGGRGGAQGLRAEGPGRLTCPWCRCSRGGPGSGSPCAGSPSGYSWSAPCRSARRGRDSGWGCAAAHRSPPPFADRSPPWTLTGHLVMSSGQMWAPLEAGSSQVLEAKVGGGKKRGHGIPSLPRPLANIPMGGTDHMILSPIFSAQLWVPRDCTWGPGCTRPPMSAFGPAQTCPWGAPYHPAT